MHVIRRDYANIRQYEDEDIIDFKHKFELTATSYNAVLPANGKVSSEQCAMDFIYALDSRRYKDFQLQVKIMEDTGQDDKVPTTVDAAMKLATAIVSAQGFGRLKKHTAGYSTSMPTAFTAAKDTKPWKKKESKKREFQTLTILLKILNVLNAVALATGSRSAQA